MDNFTIRLAEERDVERLVSIARNEWSAVYEGYRDQLGDELFAIAYPTPKDTKEAQIRRVALGGCCYVAEIDGVVAGFVTCLYDENLKIGTISNNAVSAEFRGRGIGPRMYDFVFELLRSKGALAVRVTTGLDDAHAPARRAYEKAGFSANLPSVTYYKKL